MLLAAEKIPKKYTWLLAPRTARCSRCWQLPDESARQQLGLRQWGVLMALIFVTTHQMRRNDNHGSSSKRDL